MTSAALRDRLGLSRAEWARALNTHERTVERWEEGKTEPIGIAAEVIRGLSNAISDGADLKHVKSLVGMGIATLLYVCLKGER